MESFVLVPIMLISFVGVAVISLGLIADTKTARDRALRKERREVIDAITKIRPIAADPDIRDTKREIIDAITKRGV